MFFFSCVLERLCYLHIIEGRDVLDTNHGEHDTMRSNLNQLAANVIEAEEALAEREAEMENAISDGVGAQWIESAADLVEMAREDLAIARRIYQIAAVAHAMRTA